MTSTLFVPFFMVLTVMSMYLAMGTTPSHAAGIPLFVQVDSKLAEKKIGPGRLLVAISKGKGRPRFTSTDAKDRYVAAFDVKNLNSKAALQIPETALVFPKGTWQELALPHGEYTLQAIYMHNRDLWLANAPGNLYCEPVRIDWQGQTLTLTLDKQYEEKTPKETATHKYLKIPSQRLSQFHGRPMYYRVGVVLPNDFAKEPQKRYGLVVHIGGFGQRYTSTRFTRPDSRFVQILLDGAGPFGDPYQINSANNGPYGDALIHEVIPFIEKSFRCYGTAKTRFTTGASTGGWVSLALQIFYPDQFNGCWSQCPDGLDFRAFQLIDIYKDDNAYVNRYGFERPAMRTIDGDVVFTIRHECRVERLLGPGDEWHLSGKQWGSWNAVYGPKGKDGQPVSLWHSDTGAINKDVAKQWEKYDLRLHLERNWATIGPKLAGGKINIWVGESDAYFLNNAVHRFQEAAKKLSAPTFDGKITIEMRKGHISGGWSRQQMLDAMAKRAGFSVTRSSN